MVGIVDGLEPGSRVGSVTLIEAIDRGGYGIVYKGKHDTLGPVAVKEFFPRLVASRSRSNDHIVHSGSSRDSEAFDKGLERFLAEGRILENVSHPNVVKFHEVIETNGTAYLVMDLIVGDKLSDFIRDQKGAIDEAFTHRVAFDIADALEALHAEGMIHRDVAPDNILIEKTTLRPVLIDFGGAKQVVSGHSMSSDASLVKPGFSPPEQYPKGDVKGLERGPWSDIYGLSAVLYNLVTGEEPQDAVTRMDSDALAPAVKAGSDRAKSHLLKAIDWGLKPTPQNRPRSIAAWKQVAEGKTRPPGLPMKGVLTGLAALVALALVVGSVFHEPTRATLLSWLPSSAEEDSYRAVAAGNCDEVTAYQIAYPKGKYLTEVNAVGDRCQAWEEAQTADSIASYEAFLASYSSGLFADEARERRDTLIYKADENAWAAAESGKTKSAYQNYINDFPAGRHVETARDRIRAIDARTARAREIQNTLYAMNYNTGPRNGVWSSQSRIAATGYLNVANKRLNASEPSEALLQAVRSSSAANEHKNRQCVNLTKTEQVPVENWDTEYYTETETDTEPIESRSRNCNLSPGNMRDICDFNGFCNESAVESRCERQDQYNQKRSVRDECRDMDGRPRNVRLNCDCVSYGGFRGDCDCIATATCEIEEEARKSRRVRVAPFTRTVESQEPSCGCIDKPSCLNDS